MKLDHQPDVGGEGQEVVATAAMDKDHKESEANLEVQQALKYSEAMEDELRYVRIPLFHI